MYKSTSYFIFDHVLDRLRETYANEHDRLAFVYIGSGGNAHINTRFPGSAKVLTGSSHLT